MNTTEAIARLQSNNADLVLIRISGGVNIAMIPPEDVTNLEWANMQSVKIALQAAIDALNKESNG